MLIRLYFFIVLFFTCYSSYAASEQNYSQSLFKSFMLDGLVVPDARAYKKKRNYPFYACENCRRRHSKCDHSDPCNYCNKSGQDCIRRKNKVMAQKKPFSSYKFNHDITGFEVILLQQPDEWQPINLDRNNNHQQDNYVIQPNNNNNLVSNSHQEIVHQEYYPNSYDLLHNSYHADYHNDKDHPEESKPPSFDFFALEDLYTTNL